MAFNTLLNNMELIKRVYLNATGGNRTEPITKDELLLSAQTMSQITPLEIDILFQLTGSLQQSGYVLSITSKLLKILKILFLKTETRKVQIS